MDRIYVVAGHNERSQGAIGYDGVFEHVRTLSLQRNIVERLKGYAVEVHTDSEEDSLSEVARMANELAPTHILDLHFNNDNPAASGAEVFVDKRTTAWNRLLAGRMVRNVSERIGIPLRRIVGSRDYKYSDESYLGSLYLLERTASPAILIEPCFLNEVDMAKYDEDIVAQAIIDAYSFPYLIGDLDPKTEKRI